MISLHRTLITAAVFSKLVGILYLIILVETPRFFFVFLFLEFFNSFLFLISYHQEQNSNEINLQRILAFFDLLSIACMFLSIFYSLDIYLFVTTNLVYQITITCFFISKKSFIFYVLYLNVKNKYYTINTDNINENCPICLDILNGTGQVILNSCNHHFHLQCIRDFISHGGNSCPICRTNLN
jgi:hypothetical protein